MRRDTVRSFGSILIWIGAIAIIAGFLTKILFRFDTLVPYSPIFFACILAGISLLVLTRI
ncbi:hypothetical protein [Effusibacillus pohliae]|uniref:hypothetical protein n=1 Tax=Effusibacillus pohliae TaxID=232270 RepID=UPI000382BAFB|nr:hypothetical protein [Effusibacillus pohliae]